MFNPFRNTTVMNRITTSVKKNYTGKYFANTDCGEIIAGPVCGGFAGFLLGPYFPNKLKTSPIRYRIVGGIAGTFVGCVPIFGPLIGILGLWAGVLGTCIEDGELNRRIEKDLGIKKS